MGRITIGILIAELMASAAPVVRAQEAGAHHYLYEGQPVGLGLDVSRIAVFSHGEPAQDLRVGGDRNLDLALGAMIVHPVAGWSVVEFEGGGDRQVPGATQAVVEALARANPNVFISPIFEGEYGPLLICPDLLIKFHADILEEEAARLIDDLGLGQIVDHDLHGIDGLYRVRSSSNDGFEVLNQANRASGFAEVQYAEPDMVTTARLEGSPLLPDDPFFDSLWGVHNDGQNGGLVDFDMNGPEAWEITPGEPSILVAVMDNGVQITHPDLNAIPGIDMTGITPDGSHDPNNPCDGHGTLVAGTIASIINNSVGVVGIAPDCTVTPAKIFLTSSLCNGSGTVQSTWVLGALDWALNNGVRVTNTSLSMQVSNAVENAYASASQAGIVHFAASGNGGGASVAYPASAASINAVGAADRNGDRASFSQYGVGLQFMAPGASIMTTKWPDTYESVSGTSLASPYAAGVAALVLSRNPLLTSAEVKQIMEDSAQDMGVLGFDSFTGYGLVNAAGALGITDLPDPPVAFALLAPAHEATNVSVNPTFDWEASLNATSYLLEADDFSDFSSPEIVQVVSVPQYTLGGAPLPIGRTFWWRVTASNIVGEVQAGARYFTTLEDPPGNFALDSPSNFAVDLPATPTFIWFPSTLVTDYRVLISTNQNLSSPVVDEIVTSESFTPSSALDPSTQHFWSVDARNAVGTTTSSPFVREFTTAAFAPLAFNLLEPSGSEVVTTREPVFTWADAVGADTYTLTIAENDLFDDPTLVVPAIVGTSHQLIAGTLINRRVYYWKVTAINAAGATLGTISPRLFTTLFPICSGDGNFDGFVNFADIDTVLRYWGADYGFLTGPGDALDNGIVNFTDVSSVLSNWLAVCP